MAFGDPDIGKLITLFSQTYSQAETICTQLEAAEAETPLSDQIRDIERQLNSNQFEISLHATDRSVLKQVVHMLAGEPAAGVVDGAKETWAAVKFARGPVSLALDDGRAEAFETLAALHQRIEGAVAQPKRRAKPIATVTLPDLRDLQGGSVTVICDLAEVTGQSNLMVKVAGSAHLLLVCGSAELTIDAAQDRLLRELIPAIDACLPMAVRADPKSPPGTGWGQQPVFGAAARLIPEFVAIAGTSDLPPVLTTAGDLTRQSLMLERSGRKLQTAVDGAGSREDDEIKQLSTRQSQLGRSAKEAEEKWKGRDARADLELLKLTVEDELLKLSESLEMGNRRALQRRGPLQTTIRKFIDEIDERHLDDTPGVKTVRKTLSENVIKQVTALLGSQLRGMLRNDIATVRTTIEPLSRKVSEIASTATAEQVEVKWTAPDEQQIWQHLEGDIDLDVRNEIEVNRHSFLELAVLAPRKLIMPVLTVAGMLIKGNLRDDMKSHWEWTAVVLVLAFCWALYETKAESQQRVARDLERVRDGLKSEALRLANEIAREKSMRVAASVADGKRQVLRYVEAAIKKAAEARQQASDREKVDSTNRIKNLETRIREIQERRKLIAKLSSNCADVISGAQKVFVESVKTTAAKVLKRA